jgi:hypothetical protein
MNSCRVKTGIAEILGEFRYGMFCLKKCILANAGIPALDQYR